MFIWAQKHKAIIRAELTAIGEACQWLLNETKEVSKQDTIIYYDSEYAVKNAQREWNAQSNGELVESIAQVVD